MSNSREAFTNLSIRVTIAEAEFIRRWAKSKGRTISDVGRELMTAWASSDLGEPIPNAPMRRASRPPGPVTQAAAARGMTRDAFRQWAAELVAEAELKRVSEAPSSESGERPAVRVPMIAIRPPAGAGRYSKGGR